jgi:hypothetical protein
MTQPWRFSWPKKNRRGVGLTGGQRGNAGITGALDLDLLAQAIRDNE